MSYQKNSYSNISAYGNEALAATEAIFKSHHLSKIFLDILGKRLLSTLEFGFFDPGFKIITQGEQGKDLYLLCNHIADVIVFDKVIVRMEAPVLFGDKAIIDKNSTRNATISIAEGNQSLVIKIPMGTFLRDFKQSEIEDKSYVQERQIYNNLFIEIQKRLFKYSGIQEQLWNEVSKHLKLLNIQLISNLLNKQKELAWDPKVWQVIHHYLKTVHQFSWPESVPNSVKTLIEVLRTILEKRFPRKNFKGTDQSYQYQKQLIWRRWMETLSEILIKVLPNNKLPINIGEVELFNPRIYKMRMHSLLISIQRNFMFKKISPRKENYDPERLKANNFFSAKKANNEFNLMLYLKTLNELFILKQPNRVLAQVAQQTAQLAATCENEFNTSVSKMKQMLKKVKELSQVKEEEDTEQKVRGKELEEQIDLINKGFKAYNSRIVGHTYTYAGVIQFAEGKVPMIKDIIKTSGSGNLKKALTKVFSSILTQLNLIPLGYSDDQLQELFYICQGNSQDIIREAQLMTHYWVPISEGISLSKGSKNFGPLKPGTLLGGHTWEQSVEEKSDEERQTWQLKMPKKTVDQPLDDLFIILVIPKKKIPWFVNSDPTPDIFESQYLPLLQWMVSKNLESISMISELRDSYIKKYSQVVEVVITEKKVREFEANAEQLPQAKYDKILKLVNEIMGITLERHSSISTEKISKQIYNEIVKQTKRDFPNLNMEDQGNKAYTVWRFVQTEIVAKVFADEFQKQVEIEPPKSVVLIIKEEIEAFLKEASMIVPDESYKLTKDGGEINLKEIIKTKKTDLPNEALKALLSISDIVSQNLNQLVDETNTYLARLKQISSIKTEFDVNEIQSKFIVDAIAKLQHVLQTKSSDQNQTA